MTVRCWYPVVDTDAPGLAVDIEAHIVRIARDWQPARARIQRSMRQLSEVTYVRIPLCIMRSGSLDSGYQCAV